MLAACVRGALWLPCFWSGFHHIHGIHHWDRCGLALSATICQAACFLFQIGCAITNLTDQQEVQACFWLPCCIPVLLRCWATSGVFVSSWLGGLLLQVGEWIIKKLPLVKHIYSAAKQVNDLQSGKYMFFLRDQWQDEAFLRHAHGLTRS